MMKLLDLGKSSNTSPAYDSPITLDYLWDKAAALGRVSVEHNILKGQCVEIMFERRAGSRIYAKGYHTDIREAFRLAIEEARELGAKP